MRGVQGMVGPSGLGMDDTGPLSADELLVESQLVAMGLLEPRSGRSGSPHAMQRQMSASSSASRSSEQPLTAGGHTHTRVWLLQALRCAALSTCIARGRVQGAKRACASMRRLRQPRGGPCSAHIAMRAMPYASCQCGLGGPGQGLI